MDLDDNQKPSNEDMTDIISSHTTEDNFQSLCDASVDFPSATVAEFNRACVEWLLARRLKEIIEKVIAADKPTLDGFEADSLPESARARIGNIHGFLESHLEEDELEIIQEWSEKYWEKATFTTSEGECCYYLFEDGSLYFRSSGDSEVWCFASDFAQDRIIPAYDGSTRELDKMDRELMEHLGGKNLDWVTSKLAEEQE